MQDGDTFQRFLFENLNIRGEWVRLTASYQNAVSHGHYPAAIKALLGQAIAAAVLLTGTIKFAGRLSIQARGDGALGLLTAEATNRRTFRGLATWRDTDEGSSISAETASLAQLLGKGQMAITIEPDNGVRYQGIVPLERATLAACLAQYFELSEQLDSYFWLAADDQAVVGLMLQKLPGYREQQDQDAWNRVVQLAKTVSFEELAAVDNETMLQRLFHEERVVCFEQESVSFECSCSRERSLASLEALGSQEVLAILEQQPVLAVDCQFCHQHYEFNRQEMMQLFKLGPAH